MPRQCGMGPGNGFLPGGTLAATNKELNDFFKNIDDIEQDDNPTGPDVDKDGNITLTHFSEADNLDVVDPEFYGQGLQGSNARVNRGSNFVPFASYGIDMGKPKGYKKEPGLGKERYTTKIPANKLYNVSADSKNFREKANARAAEAGEVQDYNGLFMAQVLKEAGYAGVWADNTSGLQASIWEVLPVTKQKTAEASKEDFGRMRNTMGISEEKIKDWTKAQEKNEFLQHPVLKKIAEQRIDERNVSEEQWAESVLTWNPIEPIGEVQKIPSYGEMLGALGAKSLKGLIKPVTLQQPRNKAYQMVPNDKRVASRLDIPAYTRANTWVVTVHEPDPAPSKAGPVIGYAKSAVLIGDYRGPVTFSDSPTDSEQISAGKNAKGKRINKYPFAVFTGAWVNESVETTAERVEQYLKDPEWAEVGMNPNKFGYFYIKSTGQKILTSPEVLQVGPVMVARIYENGQQVATIEDTAYSRLKGTTGISRQFAQTADRIVQEQLASNF